MEHSWGMPELTVEPPCAGPNLLEGGLASVISGTGGLGLELKQAVETTKGQTVGYVVCYVRHWDEGTVGVVLCSLLGTYLFDLGTCICLF